MDSDDTYSLYPVLHAFVVHMDITNIRFGALCFQYQ